MANAEPDDDVVPVASLAGCDHFVLVCDYLGDAEPVAAYRNLVDAVAHAAVLDLGWCRAQSASEFYGVLLWAFRGGLPVANIMLIDDRFLRTDGASKFSREGVEVWAEIAAKDGMLF